MQSRIASVFANGFPWFVAAEAEEINAYAYASRFRMRTAYDWTAEVSIYVHAPRQRHGIGRALYLRLLRTLELQGFRSAYGLATAPNLSSEGFHRSLGFTQVGRLSRIGYKFEKWHDVICWYLPLGDQAGAPGGIRPLSDVLKEIDA